MPATTRHPEVRRTDNVSRQHAQSVAVSYAHLGGVDELISQALSNALDVAEGSFTGTSADQPDGLVHTAQRRDIARLTADGTSTTDTGRVFASAGKSNGIDQHLNGVLARGQVDDLKRVAENAHRHELLAVVATVLHQSVDHALHNGALQVFQSV